MMRKLLLAAALFVGGLTAQAQKVDEMVKVNEKHDFGKIKQNVPVTTNFEITNVSNKPMVIESATGSCGCTTPEVPKEPIAPGASTKLKVAYNAAALGSFNKTVTVKFAGVDEPKILTISGETLDADAYAKAQATEKPKAKPAQAAKSASKKS